VNAPAVHVIRPVRGFAGFRLQELWRYRELLAFLTWRNILVRYKQTALGIAWAVLQPLFLMVVLTLFFGSFAKRGGIPGPIFFYAGLVPWTFFANAVTQSSNSLVGNANLISKVYFPRLTAPIASVLAALVDFAAAFSVLIVLMLAYDTYPSTWAVAMLPALLLLAIVTALGSGLWFSALNVAYRDVQFVIPFLLQIGLFASAVAFSTGNVSEPWRTLLGLNPMATVVQGFRWALLDAQPGPGWMAVLSIPVALALLASGAVYFRQLERTFADVI
jgi:lipopolysaccharide transport system permease protein